MVKKSEDELDAMFKRCLADTTAKMLGAGTIGLVTAALLKKQFPLWLGLGMGFGMSIANFRHDMRKSFASSKSNSEQKPNLTVIEESGRVETQS